MYFTAATLYKDPFDKEICAGLLVFCTCYFFREVPSFDSCRAELYKAVVPLIAEVKSAAIAAVSLSRKLVMTQVPVPGFEKIVNTQESFAATVSISHCFRKDKKKAA